MAKKKKKSESSSIASASIVLDSLETSAEALEVGAASAEQVGQSSGEMKAAKAESEDRLAFGLWDLTALLSLLCITAATLLLFIELQRFGNLFRGSWPWSISTAKITAMPVEQPPVAE